MVEALFEQERRDFGDGLVELGEVGAAFRHEGVHPAEELSTGDDLHGVPAVDVLDLVPEHTGQPVIGIQFLVEPAGDEHSSAGRRGVGVDRVGGEQGETPVQVLSVGIAGEGLAQDVDADRGGFVAPEAAEAPDDFEGDRVTDGDFLFERESPEAPLTTWPTLEAVPSTFFNLWVGSRGSETRPGAAGRRPARAAASPPAIAERREGGA